MRKVAFIYDESVSSSFLFWRNCKKNIFSIYRHFNPFFFSHVFFPFKNYLYHRFSPNVCYYVQKTTLLKATFLPANHTTIIYFNCFVLFWEVKCLTTCYFLVSIISTFWRDGDKSEEMECEMVYLCVCLSVFCVGNVTDATSSSRVE